MDIFKNQLIDFTDVVHIRCAAHILNLIAKECINDENFKKAIEKIRHFCKKIHCSSANQGDLKRFCEENSETYNKIVMDIEIRWNSTFDMLRSALKMKKSITFFSSYFTSRSQSSNSHGH